MTKHEIMVDYVKEKVEDLSFNFASDSAMSVSFITDFTGKVVKKYIRAADKEYRFSILINWHYSINNDDVNLKAMNVAQEFADWIDTQNSLKNYPDFGEKCQVKKIETLQNMPNLATVDMESEVAQYRIPCRVLYFEKER